MYDFYFEMSCRKIEGETLSQFKLPTVTTITTSGSYTSPDGVDYLEVYAIGGGGGGGGSSSTSNSGYGGGSGAVSFKFFPPGTYAVTIGTGGAGGSTSGTAGSSGTQTSFGSLIALAGLGGAGGATVTPRRGGLAGGISGTADLTFSRQPGFPRASGSLTLDTSGAGGSNLFGTGGASAFSSTTQPSSSPQGFGGGGAGGINVDTGTNGGPGGVIVIEHY